MSPALPSYQQAAAIVAAHAARFSDSVPAIERAELNCAAGRVLARPMRADRDQPPFARSTRDGFACRASEISTQTALPIDGSTRAGEPPAPSLPLGAAWEIMTGAAVPPGADCVVMLEHVETASAHIRLAGGHTISAGDNIVPQGAQARSGDELLPAGSAISFAQIALAAACGLSSIEVFTRPRIAILSTGDEIVPIDADPGPSQIRNSNGPMLVALVQAAGGEPWLLPNTADDAAALDAVLADALHADMLLVTGGVSAGKFDLVEPALARLGATFHFTGVRIQPGKPLVFGEVPRPGTTGNVRAMPFFGLPGNPVSSAVTFLLFAAPMLRALAGCRDCNPRFALARLSRQIERNPKAEITRFLPAKCTFAVAGDQSEVELIAWQGSGDIAAMARANCFLMLPENSHPPQPGEIVSILLS
jgi:molybdopterin molybdotransferase